jgi:hypothetical protein
MSSQPAHSKTGSAIRGATGLVLVLVLAGMVRFAYLGLSATRADEFNQMRYAKERTSVVELWKNPPWLNQIPLADSIPVVWAKAQPWRTVNEGLVREPFALLGWLTVAFCAVWMGRRRGAGAGLLLGVWMAILPFHVYHSREAYYYVVVMFFAAGMALRGADFIVRLKGGSALKGREYGEWSAWALMACLSHMSAWIVTGVIALLLGLSGWTGLKKAVERKKHWMSMTAVAAVLGIGMSRWIWRAVLEMQQAAASSTGHFGAAFGWVAPRVLPFYAGGGNLVGIGILAVVLAAAGSIFWRSRGRPRRPDPLYGAVMWIFVCGMLGSYAFIFFVGGGDKAKLTYFAANLPAFLAWAAMTLDKVFARAGERRHLALDAGATALIVGLLVLPSWKIIRLEGKPTAYRQIQAWLDSNLSPGDVVIVDRWYEPWNEMAFYAPSNVFVNFTVPDEPFEQYVGLNWRKVTKELFERNGAQAFIRLSRSYEQRMGLWTWPETWFRHRAVITNEAGLWLRDTGFAPVEGFYSDTNRLVTEIFYDTHEEIAERARMAGRDTVCFFGKGWNLFKPWRQGDFADYHMLQGQAVTTIHNLREDPFRMRGEVTAVAVGGPQIVRIGDLPPMTFPAGQLTAQSFELDLSTGVNPVPWRNLSQMGALLVREVRFSRAK